MYLRGKKVLLVGGAGLIGSHTVDALLDEDIAEIRIFDNFSRGSMDNISRTLHDPRVTVFELGGEILHPEILRAAMDDIDGVFLFAALWLLHCQEFPRAAFDVNIAGTFNVIEACIESGVKRVVYSSSASVYGDAVEEPMTEDHPYNNLTFYGATKIAGEQMFRALYHRYKDTSQRFDYVGLRYMNVYGPRQDYHGAYVAVIMKMLDRLDNGLPPIILGDGSQAYDFVYVGDCGRANVCAMKADTTDQYYNVGTGLKLTLKELAELLIELTGADVEIAYEPEAQSFVKNRIGCPVKASEEIGFTFSVGLREGLIKLIEWRKDHKDQVARRMKRAEAG